MVATRRQRASASATVTTAEEPRRPWRKILYEEQDYPDNHVDSSFLEKLELNRHVQPYSFWRVVDASTGVVQQLVSVCGFGVAYAHLLRTPDSSMVALGLIVASALLFVVTPLLAWRYHRAHHYSMRGLALYTAFVLGLSPMFNSLTDSISTDTLLTMAVLMLLVSLASHGYRESSLDSVGGLNAGTFAAVCLASRLGNSLHAFAFVWFGLVAFKLWPDFRLIVRAQSHLAHQCLTWIPAAATLHQVYLLSPPLAAALACSLFFVSVVCPLWLMRFQRFKNIIHGPWDEAIIDPDAQSH